MGERQPLTVEEARRRLLARKKPRSGFGRMSRSQWLNEMARKDQRPSYHDWTAEFEEMAERGLTRAQMIDELGLPWSTIERRLQSVYGGYAEWPPRGLGR